jgi:hypothetical protein
VPDFTPFKPRNIRSRGVAEVAGHRLKVYEVRAESRYNIYLLDGAELPGLPQPAVTEKRPGVGFVIFHYGTSGDYLVIACWDNENELPIRVWVREGDRWRPATENEGICVWDIEIFWAERNAYIATVLAGGTADDYLAISYGEANEPATI